MVAEVNNPDPPGRIVVVDDDPTVADVVGRYLDRDGHHVECVRDGQEALRRVAEEPPDLVVLDLMLPGIDGLEVCRRLRARWPIPVVMLTALGDETDRPVGLRTRARRLRANAVQPARAGAAGPLGAPPGPRYRPARPSARWAHRGRRAVGRPDRARGPGGRLAAVPDLARVRPAGVPDAEPA